MPPKSNNRTSFIVIGIALVLIIAGVVILNQAFKTDEPPKRTTGNSSSSNSSVLSLNLSSLASLASSSEGAGDDTSETASSSKSNSSSVSSKSSGSSSSSSQTSLQTGQVAMKIIKVGEKNPDGSVPYEMEITDSTYKDSRFFKSGSKLSKMSLFGFNVEQGKSYIVNISFTESTSTFSVESISVAKAL